MYLKGLIIKLRFGKSPKKPSKDSKSLLKKKTIIINTTVLF